MNWAAKSDLGSGVHFSGSTMTIVYGLGTLINPSAWKERPVYVFLNSAHAELWVVSCLIILCGAVWLAGAWSRHTYVRMGSSMACMVIWFAFAENSFGADDQSTVPYFCIGAAFGCVIAACRT